MLAYLLSAEELRDALHRLGYPLDADTLRRTVAFYRDRVSHGSTLSRVVHAWVLARADRPASWELLRAALDADLADTQGGTTPEGVHFGAMAATLDLLQRSYTGLEVRDDALWLHPQLPRRPDRPTRHAHLPQPAHPRRHQPLSGQRRFVPLRCGRDRYRHRPGAGTGSVQGRSAPSHCPTVDPSCTHPPPPLPLTFLDTGSRVARHADRILGQCPRPANGRWLPPRRCAPPSSRWHYRPGPSGDHGGGGSSVPLQPAARVVATYAWWPGRWPDH